MFNKSFVAIHKFLDYKTPGNKTRKKNIHIYQEIFLSEHHFANTTLGGKKLLNCLRYIATIYCGFSVLTFILKRTICQITFLLSVSEIEMVHIHDV